VHDNTVCFVGARFIGPTEEKLGKNMARAQFIVPLQHNYKQKAIIEKESKKDGYLRISREISINRKRIRKV
jgi:hypothetical protein